MAAGRQNSQITIISAAVQPIVMAFAIRVCTLPLWTVAAVKISVKKKPDIQRVQAFADISISALCCHSNKTRAPIANPPNGAQLEGSRYHSPAYIRVRAVVWECGERQIDIQTDKHTVGRGQYTFRLGYASREMQKWFFLAMDAH